MMLYQMYRVVFIYVERCWVCLTGRFQEQPIKVSVILQALGKQNLKKDSFFKLFNWSTRRPTTWNFEITCWKKTLVVSPYSKILIDLFFFCTRINWSFNTVFIESKVLLNTGYANQLKSSSSSRPALPWDGIVQSQGHGLLAKCKTLLVVIPLPTLKTLQMIYHMYLRGL